MGRIFCSSSLVAICSVLALLQGVCLWPRLALLRGQQQLLQARPKVRRHLLSSPQPPAVLELWKLLGKRRCRYILHFYLAHIMSTS